MPLITEFTSKMIQFVVFGFALSCATNGLAVAVAYFDLPRGSTCHQKCQLQACDILNDNKYPEGISVKRAKLSPSFLLHISIIWHQFLLEMLSTSGAY